MPGAHFGVNCNQSPVSPTRKNRVLAAVAIAAGAGYSQAPPLDSLAPLEQAALKATTDWQVLAQTLDARVLRMLPCDPRAKTAIEEVTKASDARIGALKDYYRAAESQAANRTEGARRLLAAEEGRAAESSADSQHTRDALAAVQAGIADLGEGAKVQISLREAQTSLQQTSAAISLRLRIAQDQAGRRGAVLEAFRNLVAAYEAREKAVKEAGEAFEAERVRWKAFYAARAQRAQTECALTGGGAAGARAPGGSSTPSPSPPKPAPARRKQ